MPRRTKEDAEKTRLEILKAALRVFSQKGFVRTTLADIGNEIGMTRGAVYWHFKDKYELFLALSREVKKAAESDLEALVSLRAESLQDISDIFKAYLDLFEKDQDYRDLYELVNYKTEWTAELESILSEDRRALRDLIRILEQDFTRLQAKGAVRQDVVPKRVAISLCALVEGIIGIWLFDPAMYNLTDLGIPAVNDYLFSLEAKGKP
jgi:AcrR family transcriptional regulator